MGVGGGAGSIARWLSQQVGKPGRVVCTDINTALLDGPAGDNLEVLRHDTSVDPLPDGEFDLIHTRGVLLHIRARDEGVGQRASALRPSTNS